MMNPHILTTMKIDGVKITEKNLEDYYEFSEEEFLWKTSIEFPNSLRKRR